jgi:hypothetical protein
MFPYAYKMVERKWKRKSPLLKKRKTTKDEEGRL